MTKPELAKAVKIATDGGGTFENMHVFDGFSLPDFKQVVCTLQDLAGLVKWQAFQFDGTVSLSDIQEIWAAKKKILVFS